MAFLGAETVFVFLQEQDIPFAGAETPLTWAEPALEIQELGQALLVVTVLFRKKTPVLLVIGQSYRATVIIGVRPLRHG